MNSGVQENNIINDHDDQSIHDRPTDKLPDLPVAEEQAEQAKGGITRLSTVSMKIRKPGK